ncbi:hypothetical protein [Pacificoceanicola onchidii]|uniref:hypothetical protein n=1 Tax=Pacificoceanicola onchidii TaxID=2562685 RepID=UPI0010A384F1|nr:hypothetical protein [Pacificoceanicola onchidii]
MIFAPSAVFAQDAVEGPFYKFQRDLPGAVVSSDGTTSDLTIEYFANSAGQIDALSVLGATSDAAGITRMQRCDVQCFPDPGNPPTFQTCFYFNCPSPQGAAPLITLRPSFDEEGLNFTVGIQQIMKDGLTLVEVPGFDVDANGVATPRMDQ